VPSGGDAYGSLSGQWGGYTDAETGLTLFTHRFYDTATGRFLTRDPMGYGGGVNLYAYTQNDPVNRNDASGLIPTLPAPIWTT
jgi:RHS repeat-associated protein